ncbi:hypothetical protein OE88DRAFT_351276 [Heliocybe sulcata]|uniref:Uncharacterized protein n=1 Tax=Heliocybe sulcata TaxID=5364 RepID=A0A5C3N0G3_9AGAM|nr:hypothetical protein OE88DRAFT_351276 [Heliocybe sulcata]
MSVSTRSISSLSIDSRSIKSYASSSSGSSASNPAREFRSSGRGGSGNIRRKSDAVPDSPSEDAGPQTPVSPTGRECLAPSSVSTNRKTVVGGRGGAGNVHSRWRGEISDGLTQTASILSDHAASVARYEQEVIRKRMEERRTISSGRGGAGNITQLHFPFAKSKSKPKFKDSSSSNPFRFSRIRSESNLRPSDASTLTASTTTTTSDADSTLGDNAE